MVLRDDLEWGGIWREGAAAALQSLRRSTSNFLEKESMQGTYSAPFPGSCLSVAKGLLVLLEDHQCAGIISTLEPASQPQTGY